MPNTFGHLFQITTWGESHGGGVGVVVDGCPPRIPADGSRHPGRSGSPSPRPGARSSRRARKTIRARFSPARSRGKTLGTPISIMVRNEGPAPRGLLGDGNALPPLARRLHHASQVRHPQLAGRRARIGPRNHRSRGRGAVAQQVFKQFVPKLEIVASSRRCMTSRPPCRSKKSPARKSKATSSAGPTAPTRSGSSH